MNIKDRTIFSVMTKKKPTSKVHDFQVIYIPRSQVVNGQKVQMVDMETFHDRNLKRHTVEPHSKLAFPEGKSVSPTFQLPTTKDTDLVTIDRVVTPEPTELSHGIPDTKNLVKTKESFGSSSKWYSNLTVRQKAILGVIVTVIVLVCATVAIVPPILLLVVGRTSTPTASLTSTSASPIISAAWSFDNTAVDTYGVFDGTLNGATYLAPTLTQPYVAYGSALSLTAGLNQSFIVISPFLNLSYTSFTVEAWIYPTSSLSIDRGIFKQCACSSCPNQCLYMMIRSSKLYMGFLSNDIIGSTILSISNWYHVAFVYNYATGQQILYLNGVQDSIKSNVPPYQGMNGSMEIGVVQASLTRYYFNGYIDNVQLVTRAKSSTEILDDASLTAYYSFDSISPNNDQGPHGLNGSLSGAVIVNGRVNQAISFSGTPSYFQAYGFYQFYYGITFNKPFSISLWINPSLIISCTFVQATRLQSTSQCQNLLGILAFTGSSGQIMVDMGSITIYGPFLTLNIWTHISLTYSYNNGMTLYVNGIRFGSSGGPLSSLSSSSIASLIIGFNIACQCCQSITNTAFQGSIDEVYVHSRELTQSDVTALANP